MMLVVFRVRLRILMTCVASIILTLTYFSAQIQAKQQASDPAGDLRQSSTSPRIFQPDPPEHFATQEVEEDLLLQEAVESILT